MAKKLQSRPTLLESLLRLIRLLLDHNWLILQSLIVISVLSVSLYVILSPRPDDEAKKWAYGSMTTLTGVWIGTKVSGGQGTKERDRSLR